jgi:hypothetical protein
MHPIQKQLYDLDKLRSLIDNPDIEIIEKDEDALKNQILFDGKYYHEGFPKIVLCGINPGRKGAGITGIPFIDPPTLAKRLPDNNIKGKKENSAEFFNEIIDCFGVDKFYKHFYVTNFSWFGFIKKDGTNCNYFKLPTQAQKYIEKVFKREMTLVNPTTIIPLSEDVEISLNKLFSETEIKIESRLNHPYHCSIGNSKLSRGNFYNPKCQPDYIELLKSYVN